MTYCCVDFVDSVIDALGIVVPAEDGDSPSAQADLALAEIKRLQAVPRTPGAAWRREGLPDPHGSRYDSERAALAHGDLTDDELANAVFMDSSLSMVTAAKDRIRWLSRKLAALEAEVAAGLRG